MTEIQRTPLQNRSMHKLFTDISNHCISVGLDQKTILSKLVKYEVSTSPQFVKEVWRSIMFTLTGKESTKDMTTAEVTQVQQEFGKFWSEVTGESFDWPSINALMDAQLDDKKFQ